MSNGPIYAATIGNILTSTEEGNNGLVYAATIGNIITSTEEGNNGSLYSKVLPIRSVNAFSPVHTIDIEVSLEIGEKNTFSPKYYLDVEKVLLTNTFSPVYFLTGTDNSNEIEFDVETTAEINILRTLDADLELDVEATVELQLNRSHDADLELDVETTASRILNKTVDNIVEFDTESEPNTGLNQTLDADLELDIEALVSREHAETIDADLELDVETDAAIAKLANTQNDIEFGVETDAFTFTGNIFVHTSEVAINFNNDVFYAYKKKPIFETGQKGNIRIKNIANKQILIGRRIKSTLVLSPGESSLQKTIDFDLAQLSSLARSGLIQVFGLDVRNLQ